MTIWWLVLFVVGVLILSGLVKHAQGLGSRRGVALAVLWIPFVIFFIGFFCFIAVRVGATPVGG